LQKTTDGKGGSAATALILTRQKKQGWEEKRAKQKKCCRTKQQALKFGRTEKRRERQKGKSKTGWRVYKHFRRKEKELPNEKEGSVKIVDRRQKVV